MVDPPQCEIESNQERIQSIRMPCFAHTLQLVIRDGLEKISHISKVMEKCQNLARCAHKSTKIADLLDQLNRHIERPTVTRWNSDYMLLKSIMSMSKDDVQSISNMIEYPIQFSSNDFITMEEIVDILEPFYQISLKCQAEKLVTISLVVPSIVHLVCHLRSIKDDLSFCNKLVEQLRAAIEIRFAGIINRLYQQDVQNDDPFSDPVYFIASLLDPAFKFLWIRDLKLPVNTENRLKQNIIQLILDEISKDPKSIQINSSVKQPSPLPSTTNKSKRIKLFDYDDQSYDDTSADGSKAYNPSVELEAFLNDPVRLNFSDYWLRSQLMTLKKLAVRIFSVQASSAPIERVFSHAGLILSSRRTRMNEQLFRDIVFLKANQSLL